MDHIGYFVTVLLIIGLANRVIGTTEKDRLVQEIYERIYIGEQCPVLKKPSTVAVAKFPARKFVQFSCKQEEKVLIGSNYSVCVDGHWSHTAPQCAGITCRALKTSLRKQLPDPTKIFHRGEGDEYKLIGFALSCAPGERLDGAGGALIYCGGTQWRTAANGQKLTARTMPECVPDPEGQAEEEDARRQLGEIFYERVLKPKTCPSKAVTGEKTLGNRMQLFTCPPNQESVGLNYSLCLDGRWSHSQQCQDRQQPTTPTPQPSTTPVAMVTTNKPQMTTTSRDQTTTNEKAPLETSTYVQPEAMTTSTHNETEAEIPVDIPNITPQPNTTMHQNESGLATDPESLATQPMVTIDTTTKASIATNDTQQQSTTHTPTSTKSGRNRDSTRSGGHRRTRRTKRPRDRNRTQMPPVTTAKAAEPTMGPSSTTERPTRRVKTETTTVRVETTTLLPSDGPVFTSNNKARNAGSWTKGLGMIAGIIGAIFVLIGLVFALAYVLTRNKSRQGSEDIWKYPDSRTGNL